jgi:hypothetical protein
MPIIESLRASSASSITSAIQLKGENNQDIFCFKYKFEYWIRYIECKASSGSSITIEGMALNMETTASSGSDIDAKDLLANEVSAKHQAN